MCEYVSNSSFISSSCLYHTSHNSYVHCTREDTPVGSSVYKLRGSDPEGTPVSFTVSGDYLSVDRNTGVVTLVQALDRESMAKIEAIITVTGMYLHTYCTFL